MLPGTLGKKRARFSLMLRDVPRSNEIYFPGGRVACSHLSTGPWEKPLNFLEATLKSCDKTDESGQQNLEGRLSD